MLECRDILASSTNSTIRISFLYIFRSALPTITSIRNWMLLVTENDISNVTVLCLHFSFPGPIMFRKFKDH